VLVARAVAVVTAATSAAQRTTGAESAQPGVTPAERAARAKETREVVVVAAASSAAPKTTGAESAQTVMVARVARAARARVTPVAVAVAASNVALRTTGVESAPTRALPTTSASTVERKAISPVTVLPLKRPRPVTPT